MFWYSRMGARILLHQLPFHCLFKTVSKQLINIPDRTGRLLDEFSNIGQIPQFEKLIATIRSPGNISFYYFAVKVPAQGDL